MPCMPRGKSELELSSVAPAHVIVLEKCVTTTGPNSSLGEGSHCNSISRLRLGCK